MKPVASDGFKAMGRRGLERGRRIMALPQLRLRFLMGMVEGGNKLEREKEREGDAMLVEEVHGGEEV